MRRENRIRSARDFKRAFEQGRRVQAPGIICLSVATGSETPPRIGVTASRKVGSAVVRNRAKRLLKEAGRRVVPQIPQGMDVVLVATSEIKGKDFQYVADQVAELVKKAVSA